MGASKPRSPSRRRRRRHKPGTAPGTVIADPSAPKPVVSVTCYGPDAVDESPITRVSDIAPYLERWPVVWINVTGLGDTETIKSLGRLFDIHELALEDVVNTHQRPKLEEYENHVFMVVRVVEPGAEVRTEQISMFIGERYILTFQEREGDHFGPLRARIRKDQSRIRREGSDFLAYCIIDAMVDSYFPRLDSISEELEYVETAVIAKPRPPTIAAIHRIRRDLLIIRRAISPLREAINSLLRDTGVHISDNTRLHLRDCYDHTIQIMDLLETEREIATSLLDVYLSSVSNRMNEIMKVLTVIATLFIPLTFLVGVYGMNFDPDASPWNMPELGWRFGYPVIWVLMIAVVVLELWFFWRKGWIGHAGESGNEDDLPKPKDP